MSYKFTSILLSLLFALINNLHLFAQDSVVVQTLTFEDIYKRRGVWKFPDYPNEFRKILMYYTLKCDPMTPWDRYNCGEWDYLTSNIIHRHTGRYDSTKLEHPYFKIGVESPDTLEYTLKQTFTIYQKFLYNRITDSIITETENKVFDGSSSIQFNNKRNRIQFVLTKSELQDAGFTKGTINKIKFFVIQAPGELKNFTLRMKNTAGKESSSYDSDNLSTVFKNNIIIDSIGWYEIVLTSPFEWLSFLNLLVDISYNYNEKNPPLILSSAPAVNSIYCGYDDSYLKFDGVNDFIECGTINELSESSKFTFEGWIKVNQWKPNSKIMGIGNQTLLELGSQQGEINCIIRNPDNTFGFVKGALEVNRWQHLAMVYDGSKPDNKSKLRLYINGKLQTLTYTGKIPAQTAQPERTFTIGGHDFANNSFNGSIDEIRIWSEALEENTIAEWMNIPLTQSHPANQNLLVYFNLDQTDGNLISGGLNSKYNGALIGVPEWKKFTNEEIFKNSVILNEKPELILGRGKYDSHLDSAMITERIRNPQISIVTYQIINHQPTIKNIEYAYKGGWQYTYNQDLIPVDSVYEANDKVIYNYKLGYYGKPYEIIDNWEIGRFITPYGIGLDLGHDGFTWVYDVTDYAPLLQGNVDLSGGNLQELVNMKFVFYKGTPPRYVKNINRIWGQMQSYSYKNLSDDISLSDTTIKLHTEAQQFKIKTRLTGHGHNSNDGSYPHCCEWKDNTHYFYVNGTEAARWHIFQYDDCALNPVYPQGGTWPGSREGWCPGDVVKDYEFDITDIVNGGMQASFDYDITKVPENNQGMGNGNYVVNIDLIEYSEPTHNPDAEIYDVIMPNSFELYSRKNPICTNPTVIVRNNGNETLTSLKFDYSVSSGINEQYVWQGTINPNQMQTIVLPISGSQFWIGDGNNIFYVKISEPNGMSDNYNANDTFSTKFNMPDLYNEPIIVYYRTNRRPQDFTYNIKDINNNIVFTKSNLYPETLYTDTLNLPPGCYTLELLDANNLGLSYWAYPDQGNGYLRFHSATDNKLLKAFDPDCGKCYIYSFNLGNINYVTEPGYDYLLSIFPNPSNGCITLAIDYEIGKSILQIYDLDGNLVYDENLYVGINFVKTINIDSFFSGTYYLKISADKVHISRSFVKK